MMCLILLLLLIIIVIILESYHPVQRGGESVTYDQLEPENGQRHQSLGYLDHDIYSSPDGVVSATRRTMPSVVHPRNMVNTEGIDKRKPTYSYYSRADKFDYKPYDWRAFEWAPFWINRDRDYKISGQCSEYATDHCIGIGSSDFENCYDHNVIKCIGGGTQVGGT